MRTSTVIQGRELGAEDVGLIRSLRYKHPSWSRYRLSRELAERWDWRNAKGQLKDIACRSLLRKLATRGLIELPEPRCVSPNRYRHQPVLHVPHDSTPIEDSLDCLRPLQWLDTCRATGAGLFNCFLAEYHYLSYRQPVGENLAYLAADRRGRPLACLLFGSAAWSCAPRDRHLGWSGQQRQQRLHLLTNNHRFLILPWVRVPHLASHLLGSVTHRLSADWEEKYGHPILLVETFVDRSRFRGTCYRAANWRLVGQTKGRTRNDRQHRLSAPIKDVYVYRLHVRTQEVLRAEV